MAVASLGRRDADNGARNRVDDGGPGKGEACHRFMPLALDVHHPIGWVPHAASQQALRVPCNPRQLRYEHYVARRVDELPGALARRAEQHGLERARSRLPVG